MQTTALQVKVDLSKYVELHQFAFDNTLDEGVTNDEVSTLVILHLVAGLLPA